MSHTSRWSQFLVPSTLFILSLWLRLSLISKGPFNVDCLNLALKSEQFLETFQLPFLYGTGYPLTIIMGSLFVGGTKLFGATDPVFGVNLMSVVFGSLSVPVFYLLVKNILNPKAGLISASLLSLAPLFLGISTYGMSHTLSVFLLLSSIYYLFRFQSVQHKHLMIASAILLGFCGAVRLQDMTFMIIAFSYLLITQLQKTSFTVKQAVTLFISFWVVCFFACALFYSPYFLGQSKEEYIRQLIEYRQVSLAGSAKGAFQYIFSFLIKYWLAILTPGGVLLSIIGTLLLLKNNRQIFWFCLLWFLIPLLFLGHAFTLAPRFLNFILPAPLIGIGYYFSFSRWRTLVLANYIVYFTLIGFWSYSILPALIFRNNNTVLPDLARWIAENTEENSKIICVDNCLFIQYYGHRETLGIVPVYSKRLVDKESEKYFQEMAEFDVKLNEYKTMLDSYLDKNVPLYITTSALTSYDENFKFSNFMGKNFSLEWLGKHPYESWQHNLQEISLLNDHLYRLKK